MAKIMSKSQLIQKIADQHSKSEISRKDVKAIIESLAKIGYAELKKSGAFLVPGLPNSLSSKSPPHRSGAVSIRSQKSQQYSRRSQPERSSGRDR
jgi:nucleoid DNA-binding protein